MPALGLRVMLYSTWHIAYEFWSILCHARVCFTQFRWHEKLIFGNGATPCSVTLSPTHALVGYTALPSLFSLSRARRN